MPRTRACPSHGGLALPDPAHGRRAGTAPTPRRRALDARRRAIRSRPRRPRRRVGSCGSELPLQVAEIRLGIDRPADDALERFGRQELAPVPIQVLPEPLAEWLED